MDNRRGGFLFCIVSFLDFVCYDKMEILGV